MKNTTRPRTSAARHYQKSARPRLRWSPELHQHFIEAVEHLGGKSNATPKRILEMMGVRGLQMSHVKSHLQTYRSTKEQATINLVVPMKLNVDIPEADRSTTRQSKQLREQPQRIKKQPTSSITCERKMSSIAKAKNIYDCQVVKDKEVCNMSNENEREIFDFLRAIAECGQHRSYNWSSNDHMDTAQSSASSDFLDLCLLQSSRDNNHQLNLDLTIS